ncbi:MAG: hypothetical protein WC852_00970 [Candidatus Nanoarchaeia archaeon]
MRKILIAILCAVILLVSTAAAPALDTAKEKAVPTQANAFGLTADKSQCTCSADTLAKIEQIKKILAELENSCMIVENPGRDTEKPVAIGCVDKCMTDQNAKDFCTKNCLSSSDSKCFSGCYEGIKVKCENSCNLQSTEQKPSEPVGCLDTCYQKTKKMCIDAGCTDPNSDYNEGCKKFDCGNYMENCQKQCGVQETTSTQASDVLGQCSSSCELKYGDCKNSCYASAGTDFKAAEDCTVNTCMPLLKQCSTSCNSQYAPKATFVEKVVNVFKPTLNQGAKWQCYDGTWGDAAGTCLPSSDLQAKAKAFCDGKCSTETNKCGVNSFMAYGEC